MLSIQLPPRSAQQQKPTSFLKARLLWRFAKPNVATKSLAFFFPHFDYLHIKKYLLDIQ
jgi:O-antigen/teichoic acid export membrane protein